MYSEIQVLKSTTLKLTTLYLLIIIAISLFFSVNLYHLSYRELERGLQRQVRDIARAPRLRALLEDRSLDMSEQLKEGRRHILLRLLYANIGVILLGGVGSYYLARRSLEPIEESLEKQNRFTADASHELRTPLAAMRSEIEVALRDPRLNKKEAKELLESNLEEVIKLEKLTTGLLSLAQGNGRTSLDAFDIKSAISVAKKAMAKTAKQKKIKVIDKSKNIKVIGNKEAITQVISIVLENAIKYSPEGSSVELTSDPHRQHASVKVADQGPGISKKDQPHIFDRFYQADTSRHKQEKIGGYGLGLSIARSMIEEQGGNISVSSAPGKGATFIIEIPISPTS